MKFWSIFLIFFLLSYGVRSQDDVYGEKRERHKVWKKWKSKRQSYNPYLDRKGKDKPSAKMARENKKFIKKSNRVAKRQMRKSKRSIGRANRRRMKG